MIFLEFILLFGVVYFAVRLAIRPLLHAEENINKNTYDLGVLLLRDMCVINDAELVEIIPLLQKKQEDQNMYEQYQYYVGFLDELKEIRYLSEEDYLLKLGKLKEYFKMNEVG